MNQLSLFRMGFLLEKLCGSYFRVLHMRSVIHMLSLLPNLGWHFMVMMNFPLLANREANMVLGTGCQETNFYVLVAM